jgi:hypothetical protein
METRTRRYAGWTAGIAVGLLLIWLNGPFRPPPVLEQQAPVPPTAPIVTIGQGDTVTVWLDRRMHGVVVARLRPGDKVTLLQYAGHGARVQTADGTRGWVVDVAIQELQDAFAPDASG